MITISEIAEKRLNELFAEQGTERKVGFRIRIVGGGCSGFQYEMGFVDGPDAGDSEVEFAEFKLFVDRASTMYLDGAELDFVDGLNGFGFKVNNPNAKSTCGCGESFQA